MMTILTCVKWYVVVLICISLIISDAEHIFMCFFLPPVCLLWRNVYLDLLPIFWLGCLVFYFLTAVCAVCTFWSLIPCWLICLRVFSPILLVFYFVDSFLHCAKWLADSKVHMDFKKSRIAKTIFEKRRSWTTDTTWFQDLL